MNPGPLRDVLTVALGFVTGMLSGGFGLGGAVISTPGVRALGATPLEAVGSTLPSILPSAITGTLRYARAGLVDWGAVATTTPSGIVAAVAGALLAPRLPGNGHPLMIATAVVLFISGLRMGRMPVLDGGEPEGATLVRVRARAGRLVGTGVLAGGLSGLLGIGGGVVMVPAFTNWVRLPIKKAIATSLVCVGLFAIPGTITHALEGDIDWRFALLLCVGVVPGAAIGSGLTVRTVEQRLRVAVGTFMSVLAVVYGVGEVIVLLH
jgi:uncharacterized membrane protein YfcA